MNTQTKIKTENICIRIAMIADLHFAEEISQLLAESARVRNTGIAGRSVEYISQKIIDGKAIVALIDEDLAGFCYIETWTHGKYVANSGLLVKPEFRGHHLGKRIKIATFELSRKRYPQAKIFSITTSHAVMKMNNELGYRPVPFSELTADDAFWNGCSSCRNYDILMRNHRKNCLCTGLIYDPDHLPDPFFIDNKRKALMVISKPDEESSAGDAGAITNE